MEDLTFKELGTVRKDEDFAYAPIIVHDNKLDQDFTLELKMKQKDDGTWQVMSISNLGDFLQEEIKQRRELRIKQLAEIVAIKNPVAESVGTDRQGTVRSIKIMADVEFHSEKPVKEISGRVFIKNGDKKVHAPFDRMVRPNVNARINLFYKYDPFVKKSDVVEDKKTYDVEVELHKITFTDGTSLSIDDDPDDEADEE